MEFKNTEEFAQSLDASDSLKEFRSKFFIPFHQGKEAIYYTGNSLGLQPKATSKYIQQELDSWAINGVEGHVRGENPWFSYHEQFAEPVAAIVGALPEEVVVMNHLTSNLHFLMVSFYNPTKERYKIICEAKAFPSDQYALQSQIEFHGYKIDDALIEVAPRKGEHIIREEDILKAISDNASSLALVMLGGVNYFSGQFFDLKNITKAAHEAGAIAGFDLAHAAGNVGLQLHNWNVDFAAWCTYKYLNSGPGSTAGAFIHKNHHTKKIKRFAGWWGHNKAERFKMENKFIPIPTAESWQLSNAPVLSMAAHKAAVDIFSEARMNRLQEKAEKLTGYLEYIIDDINNGIQTESKKLEIITPRDKSKRGCQLSIIAHGRGKDLFNSLSEAGVVADWREPNVIRLAPVPLYNTFSEQYQFGKILKKLVE